VDGAFGEREPVQTSGLPLCGMGVGRTVKIVDDGRDHLLYVVTGEYLAVERVEDQIAQAFHAD
jgi:hypothetical protein